MRTMKQQKRQRQCFAHLLSSVLTVRASMEYGQNICTYERMTNDDSPAAPAGSEERDTALNSVQFFSTRGGRGTPLVVWANRSSTGPGKSCVPASCRDSQPGVLIRNSIPTSHVRY
jgi:hypothetical protein